MTEKNHNLRKSENRLMFGLLSPSVLFVFLVSIIPLAYTFYLSFQNYSLLKPANATFAGIKNYIEIFANQTIRSTVFTTFRYTIWTVVLSTLCGVILAVVVNNIRRGKQEQRVSFFSRQRGSGNSIRSKQPQNQRNNNTERRNNHRVFEIKQHAVLLNKCRIVFQRNGYEELRRLGKRLFVRLEGGDQCPVKRKNSKYRRKDSNGVAENDCRIFLLHLLSSFIVFLRITILTAIRSTNIRTDSALEAPMSY